MEDLTAHCRSHLASYKVPKKIEFRTELPKSILGKTFDRVLRAEEDAQLQLERSTDGESQPKNPSAENIVGCKAGH